MKWIAVLLVLASIAGTYLLMPKEPTMCDARIIAFGDSLVAGYGAPEGEDAFSQLAGLLGTPIENLGRSGDTSGRALLRIEEVLERKPDIVIVLLGGNDALQKLPVSETEKNLGAILERIQDAGAKPVLVGVIGGFPQDTYAPMFERLAKEHGVPLVPNVLSGLLGREEFMSDAIHPNAAGYARIAKRLLPVLRDACASS